MKWRELDERKGKEAERDEGALVVPEESTRGRNCLRAGKEPDPAELAGGDAPPCAEPPAAPTLYR